MLKIGRVVENYQGRFAKVLEVKGSRFGLSAWVGKREMAEKETDVATFLNSFGLSQVLKPQDEAKAPATAKAEGDGGEEEATELSHKELKAKAKELGLSQAGSSEDLKARIAEATAKAEGDGGEES